MDSSITTFNSAVDQSCQQVSDLIDVLNDAGIQLFDNQEFLEFIKSAENTFIQEPPTPVDDLESQEMPAELASTLLSEEGACPIQTSEDLAAVMKMIFDFRVSVGLEYAPNVQNFAIDGAAC